MNRTLGVTFSKSSQWHTHQRDLIKSIEDQIKALKQKQKTLTKNK